MEQLKQAIVEWCALSQRFIDDSIDQWRRRLQCVVQANGGHIKRKFKGQVHDLRMKNVPFWLLFSFVDFCTLILLNFHVSRLIKFIIALCASRGKKNGSSGMYPPIYALQP